MKLTESTQLIRPQRPQRLEIRCDVADAIVANLAMQIVFFFEQRLDAQALTRAFARALTNLPIFAGRMSMRGGVMRIRCEGQGVPFTSASCTRTLGDAIRSTEGSGRWLVDPVNGVTARWGLGPLFTVRVTHFVDGATAIGVSWHHAVGDMQTLMYFMNAWVAAAAGKPLVEPLIVEHRAAYLDENLPADGAKEPGVRCLGLADIARGARYLAADARQQRTLSLYFDDDEISRIREAYGSQIHLSLNDIVCAHVCTGLMMADPAVDRRTLAVVVNARNRCGLDPMLVGNIITTVNVDLQCGEDAASIAERIRHGVDHFVDEHCDMRTNQQFLDDAGRLRAVRCVTNAFNPARWNPLVTNWTGFGLYRVQFDEAFPSYCTMLMTLPVPGLAAVTEGARGRGVIFRISLPARDFEAMSNPEVREHLHEFRRAGDDVPPLHRDIHR